MNAERLAEWRTFALESIPQIARLSDGSESERVIISTCATAILELIDALTAERARAEQLRAKFPFLPGETFYTFFQGAIRRWECFIVKQLDGKEPKVFGRIMRSDGTWADSPPCYQSECYPTADACRAAIPEEE